MLLAIDVGNTDAKAGLWDGSRWGAVSRAPTASLGERAGLLEFLTSFEGPLPVACASVVPWLERELSEACLYYFGAPPLYLNAGLDLGMEVRYRSPETLGADRLANALAARMLGELPAIVVDFGTATKLEAVDASGAYLGGAILAGLAMSAQALAGRTAKLPEASLEPPPAAIGDRTMHAIQSGVVLGHACAVDGMVERFQAEMGGARTVFATGGHAELMRGVCRTPMRLEPELTLNGIREAARRLGLG